jgi:thioredoxin reductase (NADPH)
MGVSYCATCDGAFYKDVDVVVVGGGNVAVEDAIFLARGSKKVYVVHRRDELRASKVLQEKLLSLPNVEMVWDSKVTSIDGTDQVETVQIENLKDGSTRAIPAEGIFVAVGITPDSDLLAGLVEMDKAGYIVADETCKTSAPGIFVAGDVRTKELRQIITAAADGANAITSVERYLIEG